MKDRYDDLHLADDPYLLERARWRAVLADRPSERPVRRIGGHVVAGRILAVVLGVVLGVLLAVW